MQPRKVLAESTTPAGERIVLSSSSGYFSVSVGRDLLMSSSEHHSEERMAELVLGDVGPPGSAVLVGGLGMGYTLRATLDRLPPDGRAVVAEFVPAVVEWNRGALAHLARSPLDDPRVELRVEDVFDTVAAHPGAFDGILLDVDNGPEAFTQKSNARIYRPAGLQALRRALRPGGVLVVWSAFDTPRFPSALERVGFEADVIRLRSRGHSGGRHTLFVGRVD